jgi:DNA mismatch repair protein MutL
LGNFAAMGNIIRLLPEAVANQIAAGEVVQRPASAVKELLENAVDSGATRIQLIVKDAGKTLIQVIDNGCGMSEQDARMCFERHATSKIKEAQDLLAIRTLGFRGEAIASIASVAQVTLKTKQHDDETGTQIEVHGSKFIDQSPVAAQNGTTVTVKNLFYNVPARRNFLKNNTLELKNIIDEFSRIAFVHPDISLSFVNQDKNLYQLNPGTLKQRLIAIMGNTYNQRLIPVSSETNMVNISGFIGKPEFARKKRGEQYFFVNGRYFRNAYLNHAVQNAFQELIPPDTFPTYFIYLEVDPQTLDVNIHPTKTEVNFQDAKTLYSILNSSIKQAIGKYSLTPTLDFDQESSMDITPLKPDMPIQAPVIKINPDYNPFDKNPPRQSSGSFKIPPKKPSNIWEKIYDATPTDKSNPSAILQIEKLYLVSSTTQGIIVVDQQNAHERILYERFMAKEQLKNFATQKLLLPVTIQLTPMEAQMLEDMKELLLDAGIEIESFGKNDFVIHGAPSGIPASELQSLIETILEDYKNETIEAQEKKQKIARTMARKLAIKKGQSLQSEEAESIINQLFECDSPQISPSGKPTMILYRWEDLDKTFKHESN